MACCWQCGDCHLHYHVCGTEARAGSSNRKNNAAFTLFLKVDGHFVKQFCLKFVKKKALTQGPIKYWPRSE